MAGRTLFLTVISIIIIGSFPRKAQATGSGGSESSWDRIIRCRFIYVHGFLCLYYGNLRFCR
ncbi:MAG: hypothetical protein ACYS3S_14705, partial [Planctomycetota bacterium]